MEGFAMRKTKLSIKKPSLIQPKSRLIDNLLTEWSDDPKHQFSDVELSKQNTKKVDNLLKDQTCFQSLYTHDPDECSGNSRREVPGCTNCENEYGDGLGEMISELTRRSPCLLHQIEIKSEDWYLPVGQLHKFNFAKNSRSFEAALSKCLGTALHWGVFWWDFSLRKDEWSRYPRRWQPQLRGIISVGLTEGELEEELMEVFPISPLIFSPVKAKEFEVDELSTKTIARIFKTKSRRQLSHVDTQGRRSFENKRLAPSESLELLTFLAGHSFDDRRVLSGLKQCGNTLVVTEELSPTSKR
jgi:hypothetical protein